MVNGDEGRPRERHWTVLILATAASACYAVMLGQDAGFDLLNYHYYSGYAFLHDRLGYDFAPAQIQSFHNPLMHVLSYLALANLPARSAAALLGAIQGLNFYLVFRISLILFSGYGRLYRFLLSLVSAGVGFCGVASSTELGTTYGDNLISIPVLSGLLLILGRLQTGRISGKKTAAVFGAAGFLVGAALGLKLTTAMYAAAVLVALPLVLLKSRQSIGMSAALSCGLVLGFLVSYGFWGFKLFSHYQSPFFPYFNETFRSPYFEMKNFLDDRFFPRDRLQALFYPFFFVRKNHLAGEMIFRDIRFALCYIAIALLAAISLIRFIVRGRNRAAPGTATQEHSCLLFLAWFFTVSYIVWLNLSSIYRYLSVLELVAPAFLALAAGRFIPNRNHVLWISAFVGLLISAAAVPIDFGRQQFDNELLKVRIPKIRDLDKSVILMSGYEPTGFIVPSFPKGSRFARISSTFITPGRNSFQDAEVARMLAPYDDRHVFAYVPSAGEMGLARADAAAFGRSIDAQSCFEIRSRRANRGYLCGMAGAPVETGERPLPPVGYFPQFEDRAGIKLEALRLGSRTAGLQIAGINAGSVDLLYTLNGEMMPAVRNRAVNSPFFVRFGPLGRDGDYRFVGIRDSRKPHPDSWIKVDAGIRIGEE